VHPVEPVGLGKLAGIQDDGHRSPT